MEQNTIWSYAQRIWKNDGVREPHQYCCFRKRFDLSHDRTGLQIRISADTDFILYLDGAEVGRGQFTDYPARKTWTDVPLDNLNAGSHLIAILVYYCGADFAVYTPGYRLGMDV